MKNSMHFPILAATLLALIFTVSNAFTREWTNTKGQKLTATMAGMEDGKVRLQKVGGDDMITVPLAELSEDDKAYVSEWMVRRGGAGATADAGNPDDQLAKEFQGHLVKLRDGKLEDATLDPTEQRKYYAVYYSAHWCPPCRAFTPTLSEFYDTWKLEKNAPFELIFASSDRGENAMAEYMEWGNMNYPAIEFGEKDRIGIVAEHAPRGIPTLILFDSAGKVLARTTEDGQYLGPNHVLREMRELFEKETAAGS
jgi:nucleoredoxin